MPQKEEQGGGKGGDFDSVNFNYRLKFLPQIFGIVFHEQRANNSKHTGSVRLEVYKPATFSQILGLWCSHPLLTIEKPLICTEAPLGCSFWLLFSRRLQAEIASYALHESNLAINVVSRGMANRV